ncbi:MAG: Tic22 family protein [Cyanobacteria bacterium P01_F01_bin.42]
MKRIKNWAFTLGLAGSLLLGAASPRTAVALSEAEVMSRLTTVPVFTLVDDKGNPIVGSLPDAQQQPKPVLLFFLNHKDALEQLSFFKKEKPAEAEKVGIRLLSMKEVLESFDKIKDKSQVIFSIEPNTTQLQTAVNLLKTEGQLMDQAGKLVTKDGKAFVPDVPLFYPTTTGQDGKSRFLPLSVERVVEGKKQTDSFVPFYLSKGDLDRDLQELMKQPTQNKVEVKVLMFNAFLSYLYNAKTPQEAPFRLIPSDESSKFVNSLLQESAKNGQNAPAPQTN